MENKITDAQWAVFLASLPMPLRTRARRDPERYREFIDTVLHVVERDLAWTLLRPIRGDWRAVYVRFLRWADDDLWRLLVRAIGDRSNLSAALMARVDEIRRSRRRRMHPASMIEGTQEAGVPRSDPHLQEVAWHVSAISTSESAD